MRLNFELEMTRLDLTTELEFYRAEVDDRKSAREREAAFLSATVVDDNPFRLKGLSAAVARLRQAVRSREPITVYGDGKQTRSFCYVDDTVDGLWRLLRSSCGEPVNVGNPREMTILEFAREVQRIAGTHLPIEHRPLPEDDPRVRRPDISRAREVLGWEPRVAFEDGMRRTLEWFRQHV